MVESTLTRDESTSPRFAASANIPSSRASKTPASRHCRGALVLPTAPAAQPRTGHRSTPRTPPLHGITETLTRAEQGTTPPRSLACHEKHAPASCPGSPVTASRNTVAELLPAHRACCERRVELRDRRPAGRIALTHPPGEPVRAYPSTRRNAGAPRRSKEVARGSAAGDGDHRNRMWRRR